MKEFLGKTVKITIDHGDKSYNYRGEVLSVDDFFVTLQDIKSGCVHLLIKKIITVEEVE